MSENTEQQHLLLSRGVYNPFGKTIKIETIFSRGQQTFFSTKDQKVNCCFAYPRDRRDWRLFSLCRVPTTEHQQQHSSPKCVLANEGTAVPYDSVGGSE